METFEENWQYMKHFLAGWLTGWLGLECPQVLSISAGTVSYIYIYLVPFYMFL